MYKVYAGNDLLYDPRLANDGYALTSATVDLEIGKAGSVALTAPPTNPTLTGISRMRTMIRVMQDDEEIIRGRVLRDTTDFRKCRKMTIEGELAFLIDYIMPPVYPAVTMSAESFFRQIIARYNEQVIGVEDTKTLTVGTVTVSGTREFYQPEYVTLQDAMYDELVDYFGGYPRIRVEGGVRYIDYLAEYTHQNTQTIEFGENLVDLSQYISAEDTATVIIPLGAMQQDNTGKDMGRVTIKSLPEQAGKEHIQDPTAQTAYGNIWQTVIFDDIEDPAELKRKGQEYLADSKNLLSTLEISAVDLHLLDVDTEALRIGDRVRVVSAPHGVDAVLQCTKIHLDLFNPAASKYTFGDPPKQITKMQETTKTTANGAATTAKAAKKAAEKAETDTSGISATVTAYGAKPICILAELTPAGIAAGYALTGDGLAVADSTSRICVYAVIPGQVVTIRASKDNAGVFQWQNARTTPTSGDPTTLVGTPVTVAFDGMAAAPQGAVYLAVSQSNSNTTNYIGKPVKGTLA